MTKVIRIQALEQAILQGITEEAIWQDWFGCDSASSEFKNNQNHAPAKKLACYKLTILQRLEVPVTDCPSNAIDLPCPCCGQEFLVPGTAPFKMESPPMIIMFIDVPCAKCPCCGEGYVSEAVTHRLYLVLEDALKKAVEYGIRRWVHPEK